MRESEQAPLSMAADLEREILPKNVKPTHYDLQFEPHLEEATEFDGASTIWVDVLEESTSITLNAVGLNFLTTEVCYAAGDNIAINDLEPDEAKERVTIPFKNASISAGSKLKIKQTFKGSLLWRLNAFFRSPIDMPDGTTRWMVATQLEATDARRVFPCFDEPALKATFTVTLVAEKNLTCLSNMPVSSEVEILSHGKAKKAVTFQEIPPMSTYLVCLAVGDLQYIETDSFRVPVRVYATADKNIEQGRFALELAARTLAVFEKIFDIDFPLPKMDLIAIPGKQGAMENWGLVTFGDKYLLVDEEVTSAASYRTAGSVIVHELAHQWFGNIVTMEFWDGLWLNESFADWAELHAWEILDPDWKMWQNYTIGGYQNALSLDSNRASHPIEMPVRKATQINQIFDAISYDKGCAVLRMISGFLGVDVFVKGVQYYLKKHAYGNAKTIDLWDALSFVSGTDVRGIMGTWTQNMGYPVVVVSESSKEMTVTQHRFLQDGSQLKEDDKVVFPLNLRLRTATNIDDHFELNQRTAKYSIKEDFILNADRYGFYRVAYTPERLRVLGSSVKDGFISPEDKVGLISDTLAFASSGFLGQKTSNVLSLLANFDEEPNFFVWKQIIATLGKIQSVWAFEEESIVKALTNFQTKLVAKMLEKKGWTFKKGEDKVEAMFKALVFSNGGEDSKVQEAALEMFQNYIAGDIKAININIQEAVFAIVLEHGGEKEYEAILAAIKTSTTPSQRAVCCRALGHAKQPELLQRTLKYAMTEYSLSHNDTSDILPTFAKSKIGREMLWEWFKKDMPILERKMGDGLGRFGRLVKTAISSLATREQWLDVKTFFADKDTSAYDAYLAQSLDSILTKSKWVEKDRDDVAQWLKDNGY